MPAPIIPPKFLVDELAEEIGELRAQVRRLEDQRLRAVCADPGVDGLFQVVQGLIDSDAIHRSGVRMGSAQVPTIIKHLQAEFQELLLADTAEELKDEIADVVGVLVHLCIVRGLTAQQVYERATKKFSERFTYPNQTIGGRYVRETIKREDARIVVEAIVGSPSHDLAIANERLECVLKNGAPKMTEYGWWGFPPEGRCWPTAEEAIDFKIKQQQRPPILAGHRPEEKLPDGTELARKVATSQIVSQFPMDLD